MALILSAWAVACRAMFSGTPQTTQHPIRLFDEAQPPQFVDTEATCGRYDLGDFWYAREFSTGLTRIQMSALPRFHIPHQAPSD